VLAPALFCFAMDCIMSRCAGSMGITVGNTTFTDQDYADDAVLFTDDPSKWIHHLMQPPRQMHNSWSKTRLQNARYGTAPDAVTIHGHIVDVTDRFMYLGSDISSMRSFYAGDV